MHNVREFQTNNAFLHYLLETQIKASQEAAISLPKVKRFVELIQDKISTLDFESKRQTLDMLGIKVWLDGESVEITGVLPTEDSVIATTPSKTTSPFPSRGRGSGGWGQSFLRKDAETKDDNLCH